MGTLSLIHGQMVKAAKGILGLGLPIKTIIYALEIYYLPNQMQRTETLLLRLTKLAT